MAFSDILTQVGDGQDYIVEISTGNSGYTPSDIIIETDGNFLCSEIPVIVNEGGGGGNIFIMSE